jgi:hypothetical protein
MCGFIKDAVIAAAGYTVGHYTRSTDKAKEASVNEYIKNTPLRDYIENYMKAHDISHADYWFKDEVKAIIDR